MLPEMKAEIEKELEEWELGFSNQSKGKENQIQQIFEEADKK